MQREQTATSTLFILTWSTCGIRLCIYRALIYTPVGLKCLHSICKAAAIRYITPIAIYTQANAVTYILMSTCMLQRSKHIWNAKRANGHLCMPLIWLARQRLTSDILILYLYRSSVIYWAQVDCYKDRNIFEMQREQTATSTLFILTWSTWAQ
jgi:hypothetical protein